MNIDEWCATLQVARRMQKISQRELASELGITHIALQNWEQRRRTPPIDKFEKWANSLGYSLSLSKN